MPRKAEAKFLRSVRTGSSASSVNVEPGKFSIDCSMLANELHGCMQPTFAPCYFAGASTAVEFAPLQ